MSSSSCLVGSLSGGGFRVEVFHAPIFIPGPPTLAGLDPALGLYEPVPRGGFALAEHNERRRPAG